MKRLLLCGMIICILISAFALPVSAEGGGYQDPKTGITYTISYRSTLRSRGTVSFESATDYRTRSSSEEFTVNTDDPIFLKAREKCEESFVKQLNGCDASGTLSDRWLINGYEYKIPSTETYYFDFFELPKNFKGTKVIVKKDVPFTVTGDGKGNLSMKVVTDMAGLKTVEYRVAEKRTWELQETLTEEYSVTYRKKDSAFFGFDDFGTLREALDFCAEHADLTQKISISASKTCLLSYQGSVTDYHIIKVTYGNRSSDGSIPTTTSKKVVNSAAKTTAKATSREMPKTQPSFAVAQTESQTTSIENVTTVTDATHDTENAVIENVVTTTFPSEPPQSTGGVYLALSITAAVVLIGGALGFALLQRHKKLKEKNDEDT